MRNLISIRTNILYSKKNKENETDEDEFVKHNELVFLVEKPNYSYSNERQIVREKNIEELKFTVSEKQFEQMIEMLKILKDASEEQLQ